MKTLWWAAALLALTVAVAAESQPDLNAVAEDLRQSGRDLEAALGRQDKADALVEVIRAYEEGLAALRAGLRETATEEARIRVILEAETTRLEHLMAGLARLGPIGEPELMLHPEGALASARAGMVMSDILPALNADMSGLEVALRRLRQSVEAQRTGLTVLTDGLARVQAARTALIETKSARGGGSSIDAAVLGALAESATTLDAFAQALLPGTSPVEPGRSALSNLPLPVRGTVLREFNTADANGASRPGLTVATEPRMLVSAPFAGTVRYAGPLLDFGEVVLLEPEPGKLLVLAGLSDLMISAGEVVNASAPLGFTAGSAVPRSSEDTNLTLQPEVAGTLLTDTLYIEAREGNSPVNPALWFAVEKD